MRPDGRSSDREINVPDMIQTQRKAVETALTAIFTKLKDDEMAHRKKFRDRKLADSFPSTLNYYHEKIAATIDGGMPPSFGAGLLEQVAGYLTTFKDGLRDRGSLDALRERHYEIESLEYPIAELLAFFERPKESKLNSKDASIFHFYIRHHIEDLIAMAKEIDQEYEQEV